MKHLLWPLFALALVPGAFAQNFRAIRLMTADDVGIAAAYYPVPGEHAPALLLVHGFTQSRDGWNTLAPVLQRNGIAVLTIDLRGHGQSNRRITARGPELVDFHNLAARDFPAMLLDINAAMEWLLEQPGIDHKHIGLIGADIGANLALRYAMVNDEIAALVLFSPGINYRGVRTDDAMKKIGPVPLRIVVSQLENFSFESAKRLVEIRKDEGHADGQELIVCTGNLFGMELVKGVKELPGRLIPWLRQVLLGETPEPDAPATPTPPAPKPPAR